MTRMNSDEIQSRISKIAEVEEMDVSDIVDAALRMMVGVPPALRSVLMSMQEDVNDQDWSHIMDFGTREMIIAYNDLIFDEARPAIEKSTGISLDTPQNIHRAMQIMRGR
jgi:hypothetical protein